MEKIGQKMKTKEKKKRFVFDKKTKKETKEGERKIFFDEREHFSATE